MAADEGLVTCGRLAPAVRLGTRRFGPLASPLDFSACSRAHLLLGIFLAGLSNSRVDWTARNSPGGRIPAGDGRAIRPNRLLVCADHAVGIERFTHGHGDLLGGDDRVVAAGVEFLAEGDACHLLCVLPLVC